MSGLLVLDVTLPTDYWTLVPATNGNEYSGYPSGSLPPPVWLTLPNLLNQNASVSVNILTTYVTPTTGVTLALVGSLPTGWAFSTSTNLLTYNGSSVSGPSTVSFIATITATGAAAASNSFTVSGIGSTSSDTSAPTIPLGIAVAAITTSSATLSGFPSSDPAPAGATWSGLEQYNVVVTGATGSPFTVSSATGTEPILTTTTIGTGSSTITQGTGSSGATITFTTTAQDNPYPTNSGLACAYLQLTGTAGFISCQVPNSFTSTGASDNLRLELRTNLTATGPYVAIACTPFAGANPIVEAEYRSVSGGSATGIGSAATTAGPIDMIITWSGTLYSFYWSTNGNSLNLLGTVNITLGSPFYAVFGANTQSGGPMTAQPMNQCSVQTNAAWSLNLTGLSANTAYPITVTAQDTAGNVSSPSTSVSFTTQSTSGALGYPISGSWSPVGNQNAYATAAFQQGMSKYNYPCLGWYLGTEQSMGAAHGPPNPYPMDTVMANIESYAASLMPAVNNRCLPILYQIENEWNGSSSNAGFTDYARLALLNAYAYWWLVNNYPGTTQALSQDYNGTTNLTLAVNISNTTPTHNVTSVGSVTGPGNVNCTQALAWLEYQQMTQGKASNLNSSDPATIVNTHIKGIIHDNQEQAQYAGGCWTNSTTVYPNPYSNFTSAMGANAAIAAGYAQHIAEWRSLNPNILQLGNCDNFIWGANAFYHPSVQGLYDIAMMEFPFGQFEFYGGSTYGPATKSGTLLNTFVNYEALVRTGGPTGGGLVMLQIEGPACNSSGSRIFWTGAQSSFAASDWQAWRYQAANATMMGYIVCPPNPGPTPVYWFDELDCAGLLGVNWMGAPSGIRNLVPWITQGTYGLYRRDFAHGSVLINPKGNGVQTVNMPYTGHYVGYNGYGDSTVNTGASFTTSSTHTFQDRDAIFIRNT